MSDHIHKLMPTVTARPGYVLCSGEPDGTLTSVYWRKVTCPECQAQAPPRPVPEGDSRAGIGATVQALAEDGRGF